MKRKVSFWTFMCFILFCLKLNAQVYYKVNAVMDSNFDPISESSVLYKKYIGQILTVSMTPGTSDIYVKIGLLPSVGPYPFAGQDINGNNIYAFTDLYGNIMYTDYTGRLNYVVTTNDFSEVNYTVSFDDVILAGIPASWEEFNEMLMAEANKRAQIGSLGGMGTSPEPISSGMPEQWYRSTYAKWEGTAKSIYESLTSTGVRTTDENGKHEGYSDWAITSSKFRMRSLLSDAQLQMRNIRNEAARNGYVISASNWETATVH